MSVNTSPRLGQGIYSVGETVRILRPSMTRRKVHYWLDEGILAEPIRRGHQGVSTLLTYQQVLRIRILQRMRDDLGFSLHKSRPALQWIVDHVTADEWTHIALFRTGAGDVGFSNGREESFGIPAQQIVFEDLLPELSDFLEESRKAWVEKVLPIEGFDQLVSDPGVQGGSPVIVGTRIETAFVAHLADVVSLPDLRKMYPFVPEKGFRQAAEFEEAALAG